MNKQLFAEAHIAQRAFYMTVASSVLVGLLVIAWAWLLSGLISRVLIDGAGMSDVAETLGLLVVVVILRAVFTGAEKYSAAQIAIRVKTDLRQRLMRHLMQLGPAYTSGERSGELTNTVTEGITALDDWFKDYLPGLFTALLVPLAILIAVLPVDLLTFAVLLFTAPLIPVFMALIGIVAGEYAKRQYQSMSYLSAHFLDVLQGLTTLKVFNRSKAQIDTIRRITDDFRKTTMGVLRVAFLSSLVLELLSTISIAIVAVEVSIRLLNNGIGFHQAMFLLVVAPEFYQPLRALGAKFHAGTEGVAAAERIFEILDTYPPQHGTATSIPTSLTIRFQDVSFTYSGAEQPSLEGFSLQINEGEQVALVGASGGGKTTVANLLLRFIEPTDGEIWIADTPLRDLSPLVWRQQVAWVPQRPYLFNATVAENIRLGNPHATEEQIVRAAEFAEAHSFISAMEHGYETIVGEWGARLSGGQAQRIAIARAFLRDAPILILDEATANLDPETESLIDATLRKLMQGRTVLLIAHRLNTVQDADHIVVIQDGRIAEQGTHTSLLDKQGIYGGLVTAGNNHA